jgi:hypothetical protein
LIQIGSRTDAVSEICIGPSIPVSGIGSEQQPYSIVRHVLDFREDVPLGQAHNSHVGVDCKRDNSSRQDNYYKQDALQHYIVF